MIKDILQRAKSTISPQISQPEPVPSPTTEADLTAKPLSPQALSESVAKQVGYQIGEKVTAAVLPKRVPNEKLLFVSVPDWSEPALCSVQNSADWRPSERIKCFYVKADAQGRLIFESRDGIRRNRWKR